MALNRFRFPFIFLLFLSIFSLLSTTTTLAETTTDERVQNLLQALTNAGYSAMSLTLEMTLPTLIPPSSPPLNIFCPPDRAFFSLKYPQPPFTLLQYHVAPMKLEREALESSGLPLGSKIDTLLHGHPLVLTTIPHHVGNASINDVKITEWNLYNDGNLMVHGVEDFFDPAFQTILYPWYDLNNNTSNSNSSSVLELEPREASNNTDDEAHHNRLFGVVALFILVVGYIVYLVGRKGLWQYALLRYGYVYVEPVDKSTDVLV